LNIGRILFPIFSPWHSERAVRSQETDAEISSITPSCDVQKPPCFVRKNDAGGAENLVQNVHLSPCVCPVRVVDKTRVEFVGTRGIAWVVLFVHEVDFSVETDGRHESHGVTGYHKIIATDIRGVSLFDIRRFLN